MGYKGHKRNFCADMFENEYNFKRRKKKGKKASKPRGRKQGRNEREGNERGRKARCIPYKVLTMKINQYFNEGSYSKKDMTGKQDKG